jgi:VWFA-related protein
MIMPYRSTFFQVRLFAFGWLYPAFSTRNLSRCLRLLLLFAMTVPSNSLALASSRVTVEDLDRILRTAQRSAIPDSTLAEQVAAVTLEFRPNSTTVKSWFEHSPGPQTTAALTALMDSAAFLPPSKEDILPLPAPDLAAQRELLSHTVSYVIQTLSHLPDFLADRVTTHFEYSPQVIRTGDWPEKADLRKIGVTTANVTFRNGKETEGTEIARAKKAVEPPAGLVSWGEFGPVLRIVLSDGAHSLHWSHWEKSETGRNAVFRYSVPRTDSHYTIHYCCEVVAGEQLRSGDRLTGTLQNLSHSSDFIPSSMTVPYHGEIHISPEDGAIRRITLQADFTASDPMLRADIAVEYGEVQIGSKQFICPTRSVAVALAPKLAYTTRKNPLSLLVNDVVFQNYHHFEATVRILAENAPIDSITQNSKDIQTPVGEVPLTEADSSKNSARLPAGSTAPQLETSEAPLEMDVLPLSERAELLLPTKDEVIRVSSRLVEVGVVVRDKKGAPVRDLKAEDFEVFDNNIRQGLRFFRDAAERAAANEGQPSSPARGAREELNNSVEVASQMPKTAEPGATILLVDDGFIAWNDLSLARQQTLRFLERARSDEQIGLYSMGDYGYRILVEATSDRVLLLKKLRTWTPNIQSIVQAQNREAVNKQNLDTIQSTMDVKNIVNTQNTHGATTERKTGSSQTAFLLLGQIANHLGTMAGRKNLVWISSDNAFMDWTGQVKEFDLMRDSANNPVLRALEAANEAQTSIYPISVSQFDGGGISADIQHRNLQVDPTMLQSQAIKMAIREAADANPTNPALNGLTDANGDPTLSNPAPKRAFSEMQQSLHAYLPPIEETAQATGGRFLHHSGELADELAGILEDRHVLYELSFTPKGPPDGRYHTIRIQIRNRPGLVLQYRSGYLFATE